MVCVSVMTLYQVTWAHYTQVGASIRSVVGLSSTSGGYTAVNICNVQIPVVPTAVNGAGIALSVQRLDTGWTVLGIESWWGRDFFRTCPDRLWGPPNFLYNWYRVFPGGKLTGKWRWPPTSFNAEVNERVELYVYSASGPSWPVLGWNLPLTFNLTITNFCSIEKECHSISIPLSSFINKCKVNGLRVILSKFIVYQRMHKWVS